MQPKRSEMRTFKVTTGESGEKTFELHAEDFIVYNGAVTFFRTIDASRLPCSVVFGALKVEEVIDEDRSGK